jgi:hypothetical protein
MLQHRRWESLDGADHGWLRAKYHFEVNGAGRAGHQALGSLVVWNDDEIAVGGGFPMGTFDGVAITNAAAIEVSALEDSELLLVETD